MMWAEGVSREDLGSYGKAIFSPDGEVKRQQRQGKLYDQVSVVMLLGEDATKTNILGAMRRLATDVQPEDGVIIFFSGHGLANGDSFYLIPHDLGYEGSRRSPDAAGLKTILAHGSSDSELEEVFRRLDATHLLFVIDACNSGQALESEEQRRGPMNTRGLAQLAYEKGMY